MQVAVLMKVAAPADLAEGVEIVLKALIWVKMIFVAWVVMRVLV